MSNENTNSGKVAAFGENASAHDVTFNDNKAETIIINQSAPVSLSALHQIKSPPHNFVGREKEITELLEALEKSGVNISGLHGLGGVGKTALALKLAEHLESSYPDAQFYLDLKGVSKEPLSAAEAMAHVIRSIHPTAQLPEDESSLQAIYLSELKGKKALLLMDNAASPEQIEPLIPPKTCVLLVTSRFHFTMDGLFPKNLNTLEPKDAEQLLLKIAPRIDKCAEKIAKLCGYLPLALKVAASALRKAVNLTPDVYALRLSKATKRLELIDASLKLSYDLLSIKMQRLWRLLAVFPNTFDDYAVAALWQLKIEDVQDRLAELISYSLVEWNETTRRYRLHDLVRLFADVHLSRQERLGAKKAHASYCLNLLTQTNKLYEKGSEEMLRGLALFDIERENIEAGQAWAALLIGKDETATQLSMSYFSAGVYVAELRLHPRKIISWLETSLKAAQLLEHKEAECATLGNLGIVYKNLGELGKAIEFYQQDLEIIRELGDRPNEGITLGNLGAAYADLGETRKAIEFFEQHLEIARETGDRRGELTALGNIGNAYTDLGEPRKSIEFQGQALLITREIGDRRSESIVLGNLGVAYVDLGEMSKAIEFYEQRLEIAHEFGDRRGEGTALFNSALAHDKLGDRSQAISLAEMALALYEQIESPYASKVHSKLEEWKFEQ